MNTNVNALIGTCAIMLVIALSGCVSTGSRGEYFGYNNAPRHAEVPAPPPEDRSWSNPLQQDPQPQQAVNRVDYYDTPNDSRSYGYVPVIVPWWDGYYGWPGFSSPYFSVRLSYGYYPAYNPWYSPWYDYNPFYGGPCRNWGYSSWHRPWHYDSPWYYHRPWYYDPWRYSPPVPRQPERWGTRNFGAQRGDSPSAAAGGGVVTTGTRTRTTVKQSPNNPPDVKSVIQPGGSGASVSTFTTPNYVEKSSRTTPESAGTVESRRLSGSEQSTAAPSPSTPDYTQRSSRTTPEPVGTVESRRSRESVQPTAVPRTGVSDYMQRNSHPAPEPVRMNNGGRSREAAQPSPAPRAEERPSGTTTNERKRNP